MAFEQQNLFDMATKNAKELAKNVDKRFFDTISEYISFDQKIRIFDADGSVVEIYKGGRKYLQQEELLVEKNEFGTPVCSSCKRSVAKMRVNFDKDLLAAAIKGFEFAVKNNQQFVQINDIGLTKQEYSKMNRLVKFGLAYRDNDCLIRGTNVGVYGIPRKRISDFLKGKWTVAESFLQDPLLSEGDPGRREMSEHRISVNEVPSVHKLRESLGNTLTTYERNDEDIFE